MRLESQSITCPELIRADAVLGEYGTPYYLKVDIEGMDMACIEALHPVRQRPRYVSLETRTTASIAQMEGGFSELAHLWVYGYRDFKYVDQAALAKLEGALLQAEGLPMRYTFRKDTLRSAHKAVVTRSIRG